MGLQCKFANSRATDVAQVHFATEPDTTDKVTHLCNKDLHLLIFKVEAQLVDPVPEDPGVLAGAEVR